jgi:hypothetical protein
VHDRPIVPPFVAVVAVLAAASVVALGTAAGQGVAASRQVSDGCGTKLVFLVWPKGHPAIPRIAGFPEIRNPHVELYRGFKSGYDVAAAGAYVIGGTPPPGIERGGNFPYCANYGDAFTRGNVANPRVITKETAVKCVFPRSSVTDVVFRPRGVADLYVHAGEELLAQAHVTRSSAALTIPSGRCTLIAPPH